MWMVHIHTHIQGERKREKETELTILCKVRYALILLLVVSLISFLVEWVSSRRELVDHIPSDKFHLAL